MGLDVMIIVLWMLSYKSTFSLPSFTFIKRLFGSSMLSAIRMLSSLYLRLLIFLPWCALHNLNKQGDNMHSSANPFPIWIQFIVPYPVLTVAPWSVYRFLREQVRWSDIPISLRIFLFPLALFIVMLPKAHLTLDFKFQDVWLLVSNYIIMVIWTIKIFFVQPKFFQFSMSYLEFGVNTIEGFSYWKIAELKNTF